MPSRRDMMTVAASAASAAAFASGASSAFAQSAASGGPSAESRSRIEVAPGLHVYAEDLDPGNARGTIVFIHGWPWSHRMFEYQRTQLPARGVRTVSVDLRGFGLSDKPWSGLDYDVWAADIDAVITALNLRDATLAGFSMGGAVAMRYAGTRQGRIARLALMGAAGPVNTRRPDNPNGAPAETYDGLIQGLRADRAKVNAEFFKQIFHTPTSAEFERYVWSWGMEASPYATIRGVEELRDRDLRPDLGKITVPTLILHGIHDKVVPLVAGEAQAQLIRGSQLVRFENSGHGLFYDERDKFNDALIRFATGAA